MEQIYSHEGLSLDVIAFGTYLISPGEQTYNTVRLALDMGYRSIDTAKYYNNEKDVGRAIRDSGLEGNVQVTTKVWIDELSSDKVKIAAKRSRDFLQVDSIDVLLVHWPRPDLLDTWMDFMQLRDEGLVKYIGVSNFEQKHLQQIQEAGLVLPSVNQVELSPVLVRADLREYCKNLGIIVETWGPLVQGKLHVLSSIQDIADKYNKSLAQVSLRWAIQHGLRVLPKSIKKERIQENITIFDFELTTEEMQRIDSLDKDYHSGPRSDLMYHYTIK